MNDEAGTFAGLFAFPRLQLERGEGSFVWDTDNKRYLDFTAGLGVTALGHGRTDLADVAREQFVRLAHCSNLFGNAPSLTLASLLKEAAAFAARVWFCNSGSEANEAALKFARLLGRARGGAQKHVFVAFERGFHGRTLGSLAVTHTQAYREPFAPELPGVRFAKFNDLDSVRAVFDAQVCGVVVEPVQGEGGVYPADPAFLRGLRALCDAHGAALIFDEVQCGLGRLGTLFAYQHFNVVPDMLCLAKPLAAGLPIGAVLINEAVAQVLRPGHHGSTFAGGPVVCAVGSAVLRIIQSPQFLTAVVERGAQLAAALDRLVQDNSMFAARRGLGLMQALALREGSRHSLGELLGQARTHGLLATRAGDDALRLLPPLTCTASEVRQACSILRDIACAA